MVIGFTAELEYFTTGPTPGRRRARRQALATIDVRSAGKGDNMRMQGIAALISLAALTGSASAQVQQIGGGRELDANYGVGAGRINTPRIDPYRVDSQLYVTGQVTGLAGFRGRVGYTPADQLRVTVPSATLGDFRRQSVGLEDILVGSPYRTAPYYDTSRTVFGTREIVGGLTAPGSSRPIRSVVAPEVVSRLYRDAVAGYGALPALAGSEASRATLLTGLADLTGSGATAGRLAVPSDFIRVPAGEGDVVSPPAVLPESAAERVEQRRDEFVEARVEASVDGMAQSELPPVVREEPPAEAEGETFVLTEEEAASLEQVEPGRDVYLDMLLRLRERRGDQEQAPSEESTDGEQRRPGLVEIEGEEVVVHGLAGREAHAFNIRLASAEKALREGRFYGAAEEFEAAAGLIPANPLPRVGSMLALLSAGEPYAAAVDLRGAMRLLPPLMEVRMDVGKLTGPQAEVLRRRLSQLDERLASEGGDADPLLLFVAAYAHSQLGQRQEARSYAAALTRREDPGDVVSTYARYLRTGSLAPATQPAPDDGQ